MYEFVPTVEISSLPAGQEIPGYLSDAGLAEAGTTTEEATVQSSLDQIAAALEEIRGYITNNYNYLGVYRSVKEVVPANYANFKIDFGFPVRQFFFDSPAGLIVRLNSPTADPIDVDSSGAIKMNNIPSKLAFTSVYVTNENPADVSPYIFVMG